jgi:hypothetical protein
VRPERSFERFNGRCTVEKLGCRDARGRESGTNDPAFFSHQHADDRISDATRLASLRA